MSRVFFGISLLLIFSSSLMAAECKLQPAVLLPGDIGILKVIDSTRTIQAVSAQIAGEELIFFAHEGGYVALVGLPSKTVPKLYQGSVKVRYEDGTEETLPLKLTVGKKQFPKQAVKVSRSKNAMTSNEDKIAKEREVFYKALTDSSPQQLWRGAFLRPVGGRVTSEFGLVRTMNGRPWGYHGGIDFAGATGTPVKASASGRVVLAEKLWLLGNSVVIDHGLGLFTTYNHLNTIMVKDGDLVSAGTVIGKIGSTGLSSGPHLHFEARVGKTRVNPWRLMKNGLKL